MPNTTKKPRGTTTQKLNFWAMMNNVIIASLGKGQLLPVLFFFAYILMVLKMPQADVSILMFGILSGLEKGSLLGYVLAVALFAGWFLHVKWQRRRFEAEMRRMAAKRDEVQERALPGLIESSKPMEQRKRKKQ